MIQLHGPTVPTYPRAPPRELASNKQNAKMVAPAVPEYVTFIHPGL